MKRLELADRILMYAAEDGISSQETAFATRLCEELKQMGITAEMDAVGNVHADIPAADPSAKTLLLEAHIDQIGLLVSGIDADGLLRFEPIGGIDLRMLCGAEVTVLSEPARYGVVVSVADKEEEGKPNLDDLRIHVGADESSDKQAVRIGDFVRIQTRPLLLKNNRISAPAMDNRAGVAAVMDCIMRAKDIANYHLKVLFSCGEELGLQGAYIGVTSACADAALAVDVTHGLTPDTKEEHGVFLLESGAVICRGPSLCDSYARQLMNLAAKHKIPYDIEVAAGNSGTTAWAIQTAGGGIPTMLVSVPLRYMHSNIETLAVSDVRAVSDLLYQVVTGGIAIDA